MAQALPSPITRAVMYVISAVVSAASGVACRDVTAVGPPEIVTVTPSDGTDQVALDQPFVVQFAAAVDPAVYEARVTFDPPTTGTTSWSDDHRTLTFTPQTAVSDSFAALTPRTWKPQQRYAVSVAVHHTNDAGSVASRSVSFVTGPVYVIEKTWGTHGAAPGQFSIPYGSVIDEKARIIYITDCDNARVQRFSLDGQFLGMWGTEGSGPGQLAEPAGIAQNSHGELFVAEEENSRVQKFAADGTSLGYVGNDGVLISPLGVAFDSHDNLYVTDFGRNQVVKFAPDGRVVQIFGSPGVGDGQLNVPYYITIDAKDMVYVVDRGNNRVVKFTSDGQFVLRWGRNGGDGTSGTGPGEFDYPHGISVDTTGNIYVVDRGIRFQVFTPDGKFRREWRDSTVMAWPKVISVARDSRIFVAEGLELRGLYHIFRFRPNLAAVGPL